MTTQPIGWTPDLPSLHELGEYLLRMSRGRGERSHHDHERQREHREEREAAGERTERRERRGRRRQRVGRGDVYAATLLLLEEQALHGYEIIQLIEERSGGQWRPSAGSVYPALQLLEDQGYVQGEQQEHRRVFHLTEAGQAYINEHRAALVGARDAVTAQTDQEDVELREMFDQVETAFRQVIRVGSATQLAAAKEALINARRQLYRILADDAPSA